MPKLMLIFFFWIFYFPFTFSQALQDPELFTITEGLSQTNVTCLLIDQRGFLWVGTHDGLNRYDGYQFTSYKNDPRTNGSISNNNIRSLCLDSYGNIWVGTENGLNKFDQKSGKFVVYNLGSPDLPQPQGSVLSILSDKSKPVIWVLTTRSVYKLHPGSSSKEKYILPKSNINNENNYYPVIFQELDSLLFINDNVGSHLIFNTNTNKFISSSAFRNKLISTIDDDDTRSFFRDTKGNIWIGGVNNLNLFEQSDSKWHIYRINNSSQNSISINIILPLKNGNYLLGTDRGVYMFDVKKQKILPSILFHSLAGSIQVSPVSSMVFDSSGILWAGTYHGLVKVNFARKVFKNYYHSKKSLPDLSSDNIFSIFEDSKGRVWTGCWNKGLNIIDRKTGQITKYTSDSHDPARRISDNTVFSIYCTKEKDILIGTRNGVDYYDSSTGRFYNLSRKYSSVPAGIWSKNRVFKIAEDSLNNLWFATRKGLIRINKKTGEFELLRELYDTNDTIKLDLIYSFIVDRKNDLWLGTNSGLIYYDPSFRLFRQYNSSDKNSPRFIFSMYQDNNNDLWLGTNTGLARFDTLDHSFLYFNEKAGFANNFIYSINADDNNNLWLSTNKGIIKFNTITNSVRNYGVEDGLLNYEYNLGVTYKSNKGEVFFGGILGFSSFYPDSVEINTHVPPVVITKLQVIKENNIKEMYIGERDTVTIPYSDNYFNIHFAALDYTIPRKNQFRYSITPIDQKSEWHYLGYRNNVVFSNLNPGTYIFRVVGSNNDLIWNTRGESLMFVIETPFWKTNSAKLFYIMLAVLVIVYTFQVRTRTLRRINQQYKEKELVARKIEKQKEELSVKNKNITDSINYAQRIQLALMPSQKVFKSIFPDSFILYMPKDIVSGDFYWVNEIDDRVFFAVVDCTGHGVPGAFMSIIGFELFRRITTIEKVKKPSQILNNLNEDFARIFKDVEDITVRDGMDLAFCTIDKKRKVMEFAGAFNSIYIIRDNKIMEIKGNRFSIGLSDADDGTMEFVNHEITLEDDDVIYLFSDGYADQFGGPEGKKFKYRRFRHLLLTVHQLPMVRQYDFLKQSILEWKGDMDQVDDILIMGIRFKR